jgi:hypothetical protein
LALSLAAHRIGNNSYLFPIGKIAIPDLNIPERYVVELYFGPSREVIVWVRADDEKAKDNIGGNPIDKKKKPSSAYFFPSPEDKDMSKFKCGIKSFLSLFGDKKSGKNIRKILCAECCDRNGPVCPSWFGFDSPTEEEIQNQKTIRKYIDCSGIYAESSGYENFDVRFIHKMALGVGYSLFREDFLEQSSLNEMRNGLRGEQSSIPKTTVMQNISMPGYVGYSGAVALIVVKKSSKWHLCVSIDKTITFGVELGDGSMAINNVEYDSGYVLLLFPCLEGWKSIETTGKKLSLHEYGQSKIPELEKIDALLTKSAQRKQA